MSYTRLARAIYPIDVLSEHLTKLCKDKLPKDLDNLIIWEDGTQRFVGGFDRWQLYIVSGNR
jgi:hypothetical protein